MRRKKNLRLFLLLSSLVSIGAFSPLQSASATSDPTTPALLPNDKKESGENVLPEGVRDIDFNYGWTFKKGDLLADRPYDPYYDDSNWKKVNLPYDWSIYEDFSEEVSSEIGHLPGGTGWYRKVFTIPASMQGKRITINFDGVYMESTVYVNGEKVGFYPSGYVPFHYDITDYVHYGEENVITVSARNLDGFNQSTSRWYSGSGIYRDVFLTVQDGLHVGQDGTSVTYPDLKVNHMASPDNFSANARVTNTIVNDTDEEQTFQVRTTLLDYETLAPISNGQAVTSSSVTLAKGASQDVTNDITVQNPRLWSIEEPNLYYVQTELLDAEGNVVETKKDRIGFRYFDWYTLNDAKAGAPAEGFFLNNQFLKFNGVCMHHDQGALGAEANYDAIYRQMQTMKEMGVNSIRVTHNAADSALLQVCDELGLLVIEESFDSWYSAKASQDFHRFFEQVATHPEADGTETWPEFDLHHMIQKHRNFPSIVMWSIGNEIWDTHHLTAATQPKALQTIRNLVQWCHEADIDGADDTRASGQRRFVTIGQNQWDQSCMPLMRELDAVGYNYWWNFQGEDVSDFRFYGSETSSAVKSRGYYSDRNDVDSVVLQMDGVGDQLSSFDNSAVSWGSTASNSLMTTQDSYSDGTANLIHAGEFVWTGFDYGGEPTPWNQVQGRNPHNSFFGICDTAGFAKDDYFLYQSQWLPREDTFVHIVGHYNWENPVLADQMLDENGNLPVKVYSNADQVELFLQKPGEDPVSLGRKTFTEHTKQNHTITERFYRATENEDSLSLEWSVDWEYEVGTKLFAKAYDKDGTEITLDEYDPLVRNAPQSEIVTAGEPDRVVLTPEKTTMDSDGYDLIYIDAQIVDEDGNACPTAMNNIEFDFVGDQDAAEIVGVDNGDAASWERYKDYDGEWRRSAFNGKALVIVRSKGEDGFFSIQATSAGLKGSTVSFVSTSKAAEESADALLDVTIDPRRIRPLAVSKK